MIILKSTALAHAASGTLTSAQYSNPTSTLRPYWRAGVTGKGVIVGVDDSGIDLGHCFFLDPAYPGNQSGRLGGPDLAWSLPNHRKVSRLACGQHSMPARDARTGQRGVARRSRLFPRALPTLPR
jgi:hypothetical protein